MEDRQVRLRFESIRKRYSDVVAVDGLSLEVKTGEIFGLIGPDGAGKTTSMRIACALIPPDEGHVRVMGFDPVREPMKVKEHIGYMPQRFSLYGDLTVAENLRFFADLYEVPSAERAVREQRLMQFSRLEPFRSRRAAQLSGGMKQKLALSCTLIHTPDVLLLDEPTTGVDPLSRQEFWAILRELTASGQSLLVSTPYMDEASLCDRVALMYRGRVLLSGTPRDIPARFERRLLEIRGTGLDAARRALLRSPIENAQVSRFGDKLHVAYDTPEDERALRDTVRGSDVQIEPVEPSIEDTFIFLMNADGVRA